MGLLSSVTGGLIGGAASAKSERRSAKRAYHRNAAEAVKARDFTSAQALRQMDFQERMANTQHQREIKDLRAAGLNPILSGTGGMGASAPGGASGGGATATAPAAKVPDYGGTALAIARQTAEIERIEADTEYIKNKGDISEPLADLMELLSSVFTDPATNTAKTVVQKIKAIKMATSKKKIQQEDSKPSKRVKAFKYKSTPTYTRQTYGNSN